MRGELGIRPVNLRVIQPRPVNPGLQVVRDQPGGHPAEELHRGDMAFGPRPLVHRDHRPDEQHPRAAQHHRERLHRMPPPRPRIGPPAELAVIDLRFLPRLSRDQPQHRDLGPARLLRQVRRHIPAQRRHRRRQATLITQPLIDRGHRHPGRQLRHDVIPVHLDRRPRHLPQPCVRQLREPLPRQLSPPLLAHRRPARHHPRRLGRSHVLTDRVPRQPQAPGHLVLRPARMPVRENLADINHVERPPRHRPLRLKDEGNDPHLPTTRPTRHARHDHGQ